jgi:hypothetical protein
VILSVRLPHRVEEQLADYCVAHQVTKSEAVKHALERLFTQSGAAPSSYALGKQFMGSDRRPGDVARHTKKLLRERFRGK